MSAQASMKLPRHWLAAALGILVLCAMCIFLFLHLTNNPQAPGVPVLATCKEPAPGMTRIGERSGLQFDIPANEFRFHEGASDAAPFTHGFDVHPNNSKAFLTISSNSLQR